MKKVNENIELPSERRFGMFFGGLFLALSGYGFFHFSTIFVYFFGVVSGSFFLLAICAPTWLRPLNKLWFKLGLTLGLVVNPLVLGLIFFLLIAPMAVILKAFGRDELLLSRKPRASFWQTQNSGSQTTTNFQVQY